MLNADARNQVSRRLSALLKWTCCPDFFIDDAARGLAWHQVCYDPRWKMRKAESYFDSSTQEWFAVIEGDIDGYPCFAASRGGIEHGVTEAQVQILCMINALDYLPTPP